MSTEVSDERAIRDLTRDWMAATKAGDRDAVLALMTEDVQFHVPGQPPFGKAEFARLTSTMQHIEFEGTHEVHELRVTGDWAYARCFFTVTITPQGGAARQRSGYTLTIFHKQPDGRWLLARDANLMT